MDNTKNRPTQGQPSHQSNDKKGLGQSQSEQHGHGQQKHPQNQPPKSTQR